MAGRVGITLAIAASLLAVALVVRTGGRETEPRVKANLAFTLEGNLAARFADADRKLVSNLRLTATPAPGTNWISRDRRYASLTLQLAVSDY